MGIDMEKRIDKLEADQADMKMLLIQIAESLLKLQREVSDGFARINDRFGRVDDEIGSIRSELSDMRQTEADHHKETIGFLSKHNK